MDDSIDLFAVWRKGLKTARSILTALTTVGNQGNPLHFGDECIACVSVASPCKLELFSIYLHLSRNAWYLFGMVSLFARSFVIARLFTRLAICECILSHFIASVHSSLNLGLLISWA